MGLGFCMKQEWTACVLMWSAQQAHTSITARAILWVIASILLSGCSTMTRPLTAPARAAAPFSAAPPAHVVTASWYGAELNGRRTSSGEVFNPNELTAASRSLPIGSRVKVTNVSNGRAVVVRINDRGPFVKRRSIDLSHAAAKRIGLTRQGVGPVQVARAHDGSAQRPTRISRVSYAPMAPWSGSRWRTSSLRSRLHARRRRHSVQRRIVSNPVGDWILSAPPHF